MALQIQDPKYSATTVREFAIQRFELPFYPAAPPSYLPMIPETLPVSEYLLPEERPSRVSNYKKIMFPLTTSTTPITSLHFKKIDLNFLYSLLENIEKERAVYSHFGTRLFARIEMPTTQVYQGTIGYLITSGFLNKDLLPTEDLFPIRNGTYTREIDTSLARRFYYQRPKLESLDSSKYIDVELPVRFPLDKLPLDLKKNKWLSEYPMCAFHVFNVPRMYTNMDIEELQISVNYYLAITGFSTPRLNNAQ